MSSFFTFILSHTFTCQPRRAATGFRVYCTCCLYGSRIVFEVLIDVNTVESIQISNNNLKEICIRVQKFCDRPRADYNLTSLRSLQFFDFYKEEDA